MCAGVFYLRLCTRKVCESVDYRRLSYYTFLEGHLKFEHVINCYFHNVRFEFYGIASVQSQN